MTLSAQEMAKIEEAVRVIKREYSRHWRAANLERARETERRWRAANPGRMKAARRVWRLFNPEKAKLARAQWLANNPNYHAEWRKRMSALGHFKKGGKYYYHAKAKA